MAQARWDPGLPSMGRDDGHSFAHSPIDATAYTSCILTAGRQKRWSRDMKVTYVQILWKVQSAIEKKDDDDDDDDATTIIAWGGKAT